MKRTIEVAEIDNIIFVVNVPFTRPNVIMSMLSSNGVFVSNPSCCGPAYNDSPLSVIMTNLGVTTLKGARTLSRYGDIPVDEFASFKDGLSYKLTQSGYNGGVVAVRCSEAIFFKKQIDAIFPNAVWIFPTREDAYELAGKSGNSDANIEIMGYFDELKESERLGNVHFINTTTFPADKSEEFKNALSKVGVSFDYEAKEVRRETIVGKVPIGKSNNDT